MPGAMAKDVPAAVPAAGEGRRMRGLCGERPKELIPIGGRAAVEHALEEARGAGIERVAVVVSPRKPVVEEFLCGGRPPGLGDWRYPAGGRDWRGEFAELLFVEQAEPKGVADAMALAREALGASPLACLMPDNVTLAARPLISSCLEGFRRTGLTTLAAIRVGEAEAPHLADCGAIEAGPGPGGLLKVTSLRAKGPGAFKVPAVGEALRAVGRMVLAPRFFEVLASLERAEGQGELDDVPVYQALAASGELAAALVEGRVFDLGRPEGYRRALELMG